MRIAFGLNYFLPHQTAGTEIYTLSLAKELIKQGHVVMVIIPNYNSHETKEYFYENIHVCMYAEPGKNSRDLIKGKKPPDGLINFEIAIDRFAPGIVHFMELEAGLGMSLFHIEAVKNKGIKTVITFHLSHYSCFTGTLMYKNKAACDGIIDANKCASCIYHSKEMGPAVATLLFGVSKLFFTAGMDTNKLPGRAGTAMGVHFIVKQKKQQLLKITETCSRVFVIADWYAKVLKSNGVKEDKITTIKQGLASLPLSVRENIIPKQPLRMIFVGRISSFKGLHLLIDAIKEIPEQKIQLDIFGSGNNSEYEIKCRKRTALMQNVKWKGKINVANVPDVMRQYHVLCLPSAFSEMSPLVIQEAFAAGIPVIASNVYGNAEQIQHNYNGLLFDFNNADSLQAQIQKLLNNPGLINDMQQHITPPPEFSGIAAAYMREYQLLLN